MWPSRAVALLCSGPRVIFYKVVFQPLPFVPHISKQIKESLSNIDAILLQLTVEKIILSDDLTTLKIGTSLIEYNYLDPFPKAHVRKLYILSVFRKINAFETLHNFSDLR